jgi:hypothetical protein
MTNNPRIKTKQQTNHGLLTITQDANQCVDFVILSSNLSVNNRGTNTVSNENETKLGQSKDEPVAFAWKSFVAFADNQEIW